MRSVRALVLVAAITTGCGGAGDGAPGGPGVDPSAQLLIGNWINLGSSCGDAIDFPDTANYVRGHICVLADGSIPTQIEKGTYVISGKRIIFSPTSATCPETSKAPAGADFTVTRTALAISYANALVVYEPNTASPSGSVVATYGCFRNGAFVPSNLAPL